MRIAYMLTSLGIGGAERQVVAVAERMAACGHQVLLIVLRPCEVREWPTSLEVVHIGMTKGPAGVISGLWRARRVLRSFGPDLIHSHTFPANMAARSLHLLGAAPVVLSTIHNIYEGGRLRTSLYALTDSLSVHTTAVSEAVGNRYVAIGAVPRSKCSVIANGIDLNEFAPGTRRGSLSTEYPRATDEFVWLAAGRIVPAKDFGNLLATFKQVRAEIPQSQLWIAGNLQEEGSARRDHKILPERYRDSAQAVWLGLRDDMAEIFSASDAFVLSSAWEGMPLVVGEAMAMEKTVVATDVGGVRELVGDTGVIVPPKDADGLAQAMLRVMRMPTQERRSMGKAARERIQQHFDINAKADEWQALYSRLLRDR